MHEGCHNGRAAVPPRREHGREKDSVRRSPKRRPLVGSKEGGRRVVGRKGTVPGGAVCCPSNPSQASLVTTGEGGSQCLPQLASWPGTLHSGQLIQPEAVYCAALISVPVLIFVKKARAVSE